MNIAGKINQVIGPVVDVAFDADTPPVYQKLTISKTGTVLEVLSHIRKGVVRCIAMSATDGLSRGMEVVDTGAQINVPVGEEAATMRVAERLRERGFRVGAIRPPTVPAGTSRLRLSLNRMLTDEQLERFSSALRDALRG